MYEFPLDPIKIFGRCVWAYLSKKVEPYKLSIAYSTRNVPSVETDESLAVLCTMCDKCTEPHAYVSKETVCPSCKADMVAAELMADMPREKRTARRRRRKNAPRADGADDAGSMCVDDAGSVCVDDAGSVCVDDAGSAAVTFSSDFEIVCSRDELESLGFVF
jgi:hypothetical protein